MREGTVTSADDLGRQQDSGGVRSRAIQATRSERLIGSTGFVKKASNPAARHRVRSRSSARPVTTVSRGRRSVGPTAARMRCISQQPSSPGITRSLTTTWGCGRQNAAKAS
jgi:hypothetical protein